MVPPVQRSDSDIRRIAILEEKAAHNEKEHDKNEREHSEIGRALECLTNAINDLNKSVNIAQGRSSFATWFVPIVISAGIVILTTVGASVMGDFRSALNDLRQRITRLERPYIGVSNGK